MENTGSKLIGFQLQQEASENILISKPEYFNRILTRLFRTR